MTISLSPPFKVDPALLAFSTGIPDAATLAVALKASPDRVAQALAGLWLSEGVPAIFTPCPALYEAFRTWLAQNLSVHRKDITLVGSARVGYSLKPSSFGRAFTADSDLDLVVISESLFSSLSETFSAFVGDYSAGIIQARNSNEAIYWRENVEWYKRNVLKGFLNADKVPTLDRYKLAQTLNGISARVVNKLNSTPCAPRARKASFRVYKDWHAFVEQVALNLKSLQQDL